MAADETLLLSAAAGMASLRFYAWSTATVSLGYFQSYRAWSEDEALRALPCVRRPSGGMMLVHHHEVTYALAVPAGAPWQSGESWLPRMHAVIAAALAAMGVPAQLYHPMPSVHGSGALCFRHHAEGDLLVGGAKVVGSAQRKQRRGLMQHGGILLAASPFTPLLPGIRELCGLTLSPAEVCAAIQRAFAGQTGWALAPGDWTGEERDRIEMLVAEKYTRSGWNKKR
jgi:lipoate-protein ligase A